MTAVIRQGQYEGLNHKGIIEYRGVPFAQAPIGERRFKAPLRVPDSDEVFPADQFPLASLQMNNPILGVNESSQDCLYLNIWRPEGEGPFPVMVWFHGGGYLSGSISQVLYNGAELARSQNVVVVNAAYRLGALGFADFSQVAPELGAVINAGLRDQVAANIGLVDPYDQVPDDRKTARDRCRRKKILCKGRKDSSSKSPAQGR